MKIVGAYLHLRRKLAWRLLLEVGWIRLALLVPVAAVLLARALTLAATHERAQWLVPLGVMGMVASAHRQRADLRFLAMSAPAYSRWLAAEYLLYAMPVAVVMAGFGRWGAAGLTLALAPCAAALPPARNERSTRQRARSLFRSEAFEWVSGMRTGGLWLWPVLLAGALWQHRSPLAPMAGLGVWLLVVGNCYGTPEPVTMLDPSGRGTRALLLRRLALGLGYAGLTAAPLLWVLGSGPAGLAGALAVSVAWLGLVGLLLLTKYAFYPNQTHIRTTQALLLGVVLALPGNPVYPVLLLVAVGGLIWQSQRRMQAILGEHKSGTMHP